MGLIELASGKSIWRGLDYYNDKKVISWSIPKEGIYEGEVSGSDGSIYTVHVDTKHPRKSLCTCPFAEGRRVICKHMIALYFEAEPEEAERCERRLEMLEEEEEEYEQQRYEELERYVRSLSKRELQERLLEVLMELDEDREYYW